MQEFNFAAVSGVVLKEPEYAYTTGNNVRFEVYAMDVVVRRESGAVDIIPVNFPNTLTDPADIRLGAAITVKGAFRSRNVLDAAGRRRTKLYIYAREIEITGTPAGENEATYSNTVFLDGFICREPNYRTTPKGRRITEVLLAVNDTNGRSDYIPCICWGTNADLASEYPVAAELEIEGRIESRVYMKDGRTHTTHEVSVAHMSVRYLPMERGA